MVDIRLLGEKGERLVFFNRGCFVFILDDDKKSLIVLGAWLVFVVIAGVDNLYR